MSTVESLERAVKQLSPGDLAAFRRWFLEFDADSWDAQIEADARAGKLETMAAEARAEYTAGRAREI